MRIKSWLVPEAIINGTTYRQRMEKAVGKPFRVKNLTTARLKKIWRRHLKNIWKKQERISAKLKPTESTDFSYLPVRVETGHNRTIRTLILTLPADDEAWVNYGDPYTKIQVKELRRALTEFAKSKSGE